MKDAETGPWHAQDEKNVASTRAQGTPKQCPCMWQEMQWMQKAELLQGGKLMQQQHHDRCDGKIIHSTGQENSMHVSEPDEQDGNFGVVRVKYINLNGIRSVIFTKLESSMSQR